MGRGNGLVIALMVAIAPLAPYACSDAGADAQATPTTPDTAGSRDGGATGGIAGGASGGAGGGTAGGSPGAAGAGVPTQPLDLASTCSICVRAENCCKAEGLTDCNYVAACAHARTAEQSQFYLALCRAVLEVSRASDKPLPDVCGF